MQQHQQQQQHQSQSPTSSHTQRQKATHGGTPQEVDSTIANGGLRLKGWSGWNFYKYIPGGPPAQRPQKRCVCEVARWGGRAAVTTTTTTTTSSNTNNNSNSSDMNTNIISGGRTFIFKWPPDRRENTESRWVAERVKIKLKANRNENNLRLQIPHCCSDGGGLQCAVHGLLMLRWGKLVGTVATRLNKKWR